MRYSVYARKSNGDTFLLSDSLLIDDGTRRIYNPSLTLDFDGGQFSFTLPQEHVLWDQKDDILGQRTTAIIIEKDGQWLWEGFPTDYSMDLYGNYQVSCSGALKYLDNVVYPLSQPLNITADGVSDLTTHLRNGIIIFTKKVLQKHNDVLNDFNTYGVSDISHQKIYYSAQDSVIDVGTSKGPYHFARIVNFETCLEALKKRIVDDFGGHYYLTKKTITLTPAEFQDQDRSITSEVTKEVLLINYRIPSETVYGTSVYLGHNLLEYNVSEDFQLATAVIPFGDDYDDNHHGESPAGGNSKWWMKDGASAFEGITQKASYQWHHGAYDYAKRSKQDDEGATHYYDVYTPTGGSRVFLPNVDSISEAAIQKYGFRDEIIEFGSVVAKYPEMNGTATGPYGVPYNNNNKWSAGHVYYKYGSYVWYDVSHDGSVGHFLYVCKKSHTSDLNKTPHDSGINSFIYWNQVGSLNDVGSKEIDFITGWKHYAETHTNFNDDWLSIDDYLNAPNYWKPGEETLTDWWYIEDYTRALRILALDYLQNQQFSKLVLDISVDMVSSEDGSILDYTDFLGKKLPVSATLFGSNLKPYEVTQVSIPLDDISSTRLTLGGEIQSLTKSILIKQQ